MKRRVQIKSQKISFALKALAFFALSLCLNLGHFAYSSPAPLRDSTVRKLLSLKSQNSQRLSDVDAFLNQRLSREEKTPVQKSSSKELRRLVNLRREYKLRQDFLDRLILQVNSHFQTNQQSLVTFFKKRVRQMALIESRAQGQSPMARFLDSLTSALSKTQMSDPSVVDFIEGYMESASLSEPKAAGDVLKNQNYSNGVASSSGSPVPRDKIGDELEEKLRVFQTR